MRQENFPCHITLICYSVFHIVNARLYKNAMCDDETVAAGQRGKKSVKCWAEEADKNTKDAALETLW